MGHITKTEKSCLKERSTPNRLTQKISNYTDTTFSDPVKPFLKWAGGKSQLLNEFENHFPEELGTSKIKKYVEPFVGGGAVLFDVIQKYEFDECHICDINDELILAYEVVKYNVDELVEILRTFESEFLNLDNEERKKYYYSVREKYNATRANIDFGRYQPSWINRAAQLIFLNRTCFNGLFRVNSKGEFNVPFGRYKNPKILNEANLINVSYLLNKNNVQVHLGDFSECEPFVDNLTFVYLDPPYRPLNQTSNFTSYSRDSFTENDQLRLAEFYKKLDSKGAKVMLSNSDPKNEDPEDEFFENNYSAFVIKRVEAKRMINSKGNKRGPIKELIITNY